MADWKRLSKKLALADGYIERKEVAILQEEFLSDGVVNKSEAEFLVDLRKNAEKAVIEFHEFVFEVTKKALLEDGTLSADEAKWLEKFILADGKVDDLEKKFLTDLKASAKSISPEAEALFKKFLG